jgi:hypothetical protein
MSALQTRIWKRFANSNSLFHPTQHQQMQSFCELDLSLKKRNKVINAFDDFVQSKIDADWSAFLTTFMFRPLSGNHFSKFSQMKREIERIYSIFLPRVVRYPNSRRAKLPIMIAMVDLPVFKWNNKSPVVDLKINGGLHLHAILLVPPKSRLKTSVERHFEQHSSLYLGDRRTVDRIQVDQIVTKSSCNVTDYVFKALSRGLSYDEHILILPKAFSEMAKSDLPPT